MTLLREDGGILAVLELERLFGHRYYGFPVDEEELERAFSRGYAELLDQAGMIHHGAKNGGEKILHKICVLPAAATGKALETVMKKTLRCASWKFAGHHQSHAAQAFYDAPFRSALVLSYDGGGDVHQNFEVYLGEKRTSSSTPSFLELVMVHKMNLGTVYQECATYLQEVTGDKVRKEQYNRALSGKMMGYLALGKERPEWASPLERVYRGIASQETALRDLLGKAPTIPEQRDFAASCQTVFEQILFEVFDEHLTLYPSVDGIVVSGGCALNVLSNRKLQLRYGLPFHVSPAPNDSGLSLGGAQIFTPPLDTRGSAPPAPSMYLGPLLFDRHAVPAYIEMAGLGYGARTVDVEDLASILNDGAIIAVVRGRSEFGPRALGHRSLIAVPHLPEIKQKMNRLKFREWWRPVAPMVTLEDAKRYVQSSISGFCVFVFIFLPWLTDQSLLFFSLSRDRVFAGCS